MSSRHAFVPVAAVCIAAFAASLAGNATAEPGASLTRTQEQGENRPVVRSARRDFAANERFVTNPNETLELLLSDGTSIVLAPDSEIVLNGYEYSREARSGRLDLAVNRGTVRVAGGVVNNTRAIDMRTPFGDVALTNGIAIVELRLEHADLTLVVGEALEVVGAGTEGRATGGASRLRLAGEGRVSRQDATTSDLRALVTRLNPGLASGMVPVVVDEGVSRASEEPSALDFLEAGLAGQGARNANPGAPFGPGFGGPFQPIRLAGGDVTLGSTATTSASDWVWSLHRERLGGTATINDDGTISVEPTRPIDPDSPEEYPLRPPARVAGPGGNSTAWIYANADAGFSQAVTSTAPRWLPNMYFAVGTRDKLDGEPDEVWDVDLAQTLWLYDPGLYDPDPDQGAAEFTIEWAAQPFETTENADCTNPPSSPCIDAAFTFEADFLETSISQPQVDFFPSQDDNLLGPCREPPGECATFSALQAGFHLDPDDPVTLTVTGVDDDPPPNGDGSFDRWLVCRGDQRCESNDPSVATYAAILLNRAEASNLNEIVGADGSRTVTFTDVQLARDHFLYIEGKAATGGTDPDLFMYATGFASGRGATPGVASAAPLRVDRFTVSAGLTGLPARAFLAPSDSSLPYYDSGLWVINPETQDYLSTQSRMLHADFALGACGNGRQCSDISLSLGTLSYDDQNGGAARGRTLASTRGLVTENGVAHERILDTESTWASSVAGGGNTELDHPGRVGYMVLDNYYPGHVEYGGAVARAIAAPPGIVDVFAVTRLAVGQNTVDIGQLNARNAGVSVTGGFLAGLVDRDDPDNRVVHTLRSGSDGVVLAADTVASTLSGTVKATVYVDGNHSETATLDVGGSTYDSAYLDAKRWGAFAGEASETSVPPTAGLVCANLVIDGWENAATAPSGGQAPPQYAFRQAVNGEGSTLYRHLQWGFFFGDFVTTSESTPEDTTSWHAHLVPWVGGRLTADNAVLPTGSVTYEGHAVGNVLEGGASRSVVGTYVNTWNFASRLGTGTLDFDSRLYPIRTQLAAGSSARFDGFLLEPVQTPEDANAASSFGPRAGELAGSFMQGGSDTHAALAGTFIINRAENGTTYQAAGVFGAESIAQGGN